MDILSFSKITKPIYEGGLSIDCRPRGKWLVEVRRTDGTIRRPFEDKWIDNLFINRYANGQLSGTTGSFGSGASWAGYNTNISVYSFLDLFYGTVSSIAVGSGSTAVSVTDTALATPIRHDSTPYPSGNTVSYNSTTGDIVYTIKEQFPAETGSVTYREAGIRLVSASGFTPINGLAEANGLVNRVVFPGNVNLTAGEQLILTVAVTIPTLANSTGKTITIAAQNGVNISGVLKVIGTQASMAGGTVTAGGVLSRDTTHPILFNAQQTPVALLSTKTAFDTLGVNPTWGTTGELSGTWNTYNTNSRYRDICFQWSAGTPAVDTNFRSLLFRKVTTAGANGGYQLLLDNQMTKTAASTLTLSLRFRV
jgi:hypothetical protein